MALTYDIKNDIRYQEGIEMTISIINLLNNNFSKSQIAEKLQISLEVVEKVADSMKKK